MNADPLLFDDIMAQYGQDVWNLAYTLTRRVDLADDVTQDVFLSIYQKLDTFRGDASLRTWLLRITRNKAYDCRRSYYLRKVTLVDLFIERGQHPSAEQEALGNLVTDDAWAAVLKLPVKYREVLILHAHYNMTNAEIAVVLDLLEATVKTRLHRARKKAYELMKGDA
ncbi:sigma-70 family RNA polymerase sigma factor [Tumebacillus avium]|nr:sigma-70 family RNA polymerase sigma factor [Tumebacillus avium]